MAAVGGQKACERTGRQTLIGPMAPPPGPWGMRNRALSSRETVCSRRERSGSIPCQSIYMRPALSACATTWIHCLDISSSARCIPAQRHAPWTGGGSSTACGRRGWFLAARPLYPSDPAFWGAGTSARHRGRVRTMLGCPFAAADNNVSQDWRRSRARGTGLVVVAVKAKQRRYIPLYDRASHDYVRGALARAESRAT